MNWDLTTMSQRKRLLGRLIVAYVVLFGAAAVNASWAEDAAPGSNQRDVLPAGPGPGQRQAGSDDAGVHENATDKVDSSGGNIGERHTGSTGGAKGEEGTDSKGVWRGENHAGTKPSGTDLGPIDTRITALGKSQFGRSKEYGWKKSKIARPSGNSRDSHRNWTRDTKGGVLRNAIGVPVHRSSADRTGTDKGFQGVVVGSRKNASSPGNGGTEAVGTDPHHQGFVPLRAGGITSHDPQINTAMNHSIISGRDLIRPGLGAGVIGGPAKNVAGVINGTNFWPRHP